MVFPAFVNMREGALEYLLVTTYGKTHESLLRTDVEPQQVHVAMLLLGGRGAGTNEVPADPSNLIPGDRITIEVLWKKKSKEYHARAETFVRDRKKKAPMSDGVWIYNGSRMREEGFAAQMDGSIVSLITDADALVNNPRPGREDDDNWLAKGSRLPEFNEPVRVQITIATPGDGRK